MRSGPILLVAAGLSAGGAAGAQSAKVGDTATITLERQSTDKGDDGSSGSATDRDSIVERVVALRDGGVELVYDLPADATEQDRASTWQFPVRVFRPDHGPARLLNRAELVTRVDVWLKTAGWTRAICGRLIFTWNAFRIACEPETALTTIAAYDIGWDMVRAGDAYRDPDASAAVPLEKRAGADGAASLVATMTLDPQNARREAVDTDVAVAELTGKPIGRDVAVAAHATDEIAGTIVATLDIDAAGHAFRRMVVTNATIRRPGQPSKVRSVTETLTKRPFGARSVTPLGIAADRR